MLGISSRVEGGSIAKYGVTEVYSRVSFFNSWIQNITNEDEMYGLQFSLPKLDKLPTGLSEKILPKVCADIGLRPNATVVRLKPLRSIRSFTQRLVLSFLFLQLAITARAP